MANKEEREGKKILTGGLESSDNRRSKRMVTQTSGADPRIVAFVRMLARKAAERDHARNVRRNGAAHIDLPEEE